MQNDADKESRSDVRSIRHNDSPASRRTGAFVDLSWYDRSGWSSFGSIRLGIKLSGT